MASVLPQQLERRRLIGHADGLARGYDQADVQGGALLTESGSPATQSLVSQWEGGAVLVPPERWVAIETVTRNEVARADLRPDVLPPPAKKRRKAA